MTSASELEAAGEDTEGLIEDAAKLYSTIKKLTTTQSNPEGVSILTNTGDFKSTYEILLDISKVWGELNDKSQASLLETIAGKNRASVVSAILQAKDDSGNPLLESVYNASVNSAGAADEAMQTALSSIESAQKRMQNAWQSMFQDSNLDFWLETLYKMATALIHVADNLHLVDGAITGVIAGFATFKYIIPLINSLASAAMAAKVGISLAGGALGVLVGVGLTAGAKLLSDFIRREEIAIEKGEELKKTFSEQTDAIKSNISTIQKYTDRFEELSKGVSENGENISLTADEYNEYKNIVSDIIGMQPSLARGYSEENGYLVEKNTLLAEAISLEEKSLLLEKANQGKADNVHTLAKSDNSQYRKDLKEYEDALSTFVNGVLDGLNKSSGALNISELDDYLSEFFNVDISEYSGNYLQLFEDNAIYLRENFESFLSGLDINQDLKEDMLSRWFDFTGVEIPQKSTDAIEALFQGVVSQFEYYNGSSETTDAVEKLLDLTKSGFSDIDLSDSDTEKAFRNSIYDLVKLTAEDPELASNIASIFDLNLTEMSADAAIAAIQARLDAILPALPDYLQNWFGNAFNARSLYMAQGYSDYTSIKDKTTLRNEEIAKASKDYEGNLATLNAFTSELSTNQKELWIVATEGETSAELAIRAYNRACKDAEIATSDVIISSKSAFETYSTSISNLSGYLDKIKDGSLSISDVTNAITEFGLDFSKIDFTSGKFEGFADLIQDKANEALEEFIETLGDIEDPNIQAWIDALKEEQTEALKAATANRELKDSMNDMADFASVMSSLQSAYDSLKDGDAISTSDWSSLVENFGDLPSFEDFIDSAAGAKSITKDVQDAFNRLVTEAIYMSDVMDNIIEQNGEYSESQKALLEAMLEEAGVTNSAAVANEILGQTLGGLILKKMSLGDETYSLTNLTEAQRIAVLNEIDALLQEGNAAQLTEQALAQLELAKMLLNGITINTYGDIEQIVGLANAAGAGAAELNKLIAAKNAFARIEAGFTPTAEDLQAIDDAYSAANTVASQRLSASDFISTATNANFGGSKSSGGGADTANTIDWISRKLELLEDSISDLAETAADAYEPWVVRNQALQDEIDATTALIGIQQDAYDEYMAKANAVDISDEYKKLVQEGGDLIETFENQDLYEAVNEYKDYYDQAQQCQDKIKDLIKSVKELNSQKLDNIIEEYEDFGERAESLVKILQNDTAINGTDHSELIFSIMKEQVDKYQEGYNQALSALAYKYNNGVYGFEDQTNYMYGNYAISSRKTAEQTDAAARAMEELGFSADRMTQSIVTSTEELFDASGNSTGVFIQFTPVLPDGQVATAETLKAYFNEITQDGKITSAEAIMIADQNGAEINGQYISNMITAVIDQVPDVFRSALENSAGSLSFGGSMSDVMDAVKEYIKNSIVSSGVSSSYGLSGDTWDSALDDFTEDFVQTYFGGVDVSGVESVFEDSLEGLIKSIFASFRSLVVQYYIDNNLDLSELPDIVESSKGYAQQYNEDLEKVAKLGEDTREYAKSYVDAQTSQYDSILSLLNAQISNAFTENKGIVGGGVSLNEQVSLLEEQSSIQKKIYELLLKDIMANNDPNSEIYQYAKEMLTQLEGTIDDNTAKIVQAILDDFNRVVKAYDNAMGLLEHRETMINLNMELADLQGYMASGVWYEYLIKNAEEELALLQQEKQVLQEKLDAAVDSGYVEVYSEAWYEMQNQINEVDEEILQTTIDIQKFKNEIRQIEWDRFDYMQEQIGTLNDEFEFLIKLIENSEDLIDDYGNFTDYGWTSISLYQKQFETYAKLVSNYRKEIADLDADFANDPLNKDYIERRQQLLETEREYILSQQEAKNAIIDLVRDAYDQQLEKLQEIIDKKKESLQAEKDLYDYQKKVRDQTKDIADIQKQLSAYANDDSEEAKKTIQELKVDLKDAMSNLQDSEYDKYVSDQEQMLDRLYTDYEDWIDMRMDDTDALIEDILAQLDEKGAVVEECLTEIAGTWNYDRLIESVESIEARVTAMFERADANAQEKSQEVWDNTITQPLDTIYNGETIQSIADKAGGSSISSSASSGGSSSATSPGSSSSGPPDDDWYKYNHSSPSVFSPQYKNSNGDDYSTYGIGTAEYEKLVLTAASNGYNLADDKDKFGDTDWYQAAEEILKKNKSSYSTGGPLGKAIKASGEDGIFFGRLGEEIVTPDELDKLSDIFEQVDLMKNIRGKYNFPASVVQNSTSMGDVKLEITLPNVQNYEDFRRQLVRDPNFEKATLTMVNNAVVGKNSLAKLKYS